MKKIFQYCILLAIALTSCKKDNPHFPGHDKTDSQLLTGWIGLHLRLIQNTTGVTHIAFSRHFSYTGVALYESLVKGDPRYKSVVTRLNGSLGLPVVSKVESIFYPASANAAIAAMLRFFYSAKPENVASIDSLEAVYHQKFADHNSNKFDLPASVNYGKQIAAAVVEWSKQDGASAANIPYTLQGEGYWEPTPTGFAPANMPGWGNNRTLVAGSITGTMPAAPPAFSSNPASGFYAMVKEVVDASQSLTPDQIAIAFFWDDAPNGKNVSVFGHWFSIYKQALEKEKTPLMKGAEGYLRLGIAMNDATISCWQSKYTFHTIRPITYINKYMGLPAWSSKIPTPPHPEYLSAHSTISGSGVFALESVFGKKFSFTDHTYDAIGMSPRSFSSLEAAAKEAGLSRLYAGIHYRPSIDAGGIQGRKVGENVINLLKTH